MSRLGSSLVGAVGGGRRASTRQPDFQAIIKRMEQAQTDSNAANETRFTNLLASISGTKAEVGGSYQQAFDALGGQGDVARKRVTQGATRRGARAEQDLISRGLGNTTVRAGVKRGIADDAETQQQSIDEMVNRQRSGLLQGQAGTQLQLGSMMSGAIEGRNDLGPDLGLYAQLLQAAGAANTDPLQVSVGRGLPSGGGFNSGGAGANVPSISGSGSSGPGYANWAGTGSWQNQGGGTQSASASGMTSYSGPDAKPLDLSPTSSPGQQSTSRAVTIRAGGRARGATPGQRKTIQVASGLTNVQAIKRGIIPWGWGIV